MWSDVVDEAFAQESHCKVGEGRFKNIQKIGNLKNPTDISNLNFLNLKNPFFFLKKILFFEKIDFKFSKSVIFAKKNSNFKFLKKVFKKLLFFYR